ncbi:MAG: hypothetical protein HJHJAOHD_02536 [Flavobacteriales bacterium]|nr:hypothetical protein [Flavobacteriales bacterium]
MPKTTAHTSTNYPFGSTQPNPNNLNANRYRYGFGGMEQDKQTGSYTTYFRQYDPRIARWKSTDPVTQPWQSPYTAFDNNPIFYTDPSGAIAVPNKRRGIGAGGGIGGIGGALAGSAQTVLSLAIRSGMQASMVGTYMQSAMLPTSSATNSGRELGVGNESGLANNIAANDLYACTTCPQPLNESGGTNVQNTLVLPLGTPVMTPTDGIWESLWHTAYPRTYGMQEVDNLGNISSGIQPITGTGPTTSIGKLGAYIELAKLTKGFNGAIQAHHLVEVRHLRRLMMSAKNAPSVILSKADHAAMTKTLQQLLPYGQTYSKSQIINAYKQAYSKYPEWVDLVIKYLQ